MARTIDKIITKVNGTYGAPMGRSNKGTRPNPLVKGLYGGTKPKIFPVVKIYDCAVPMSGDGAYDKGGAYWGIGKQLRVSYTKDLSYVEFYRINEKHF